MAPKSGIRILALFGSRVLFGQERANIETLVQLKEHGCNVLCLIRDDEWPEIIEIRKTLDEVGLDWVTIPYIDYPARGWLIHILRRNPGAFIRANMKLLKIVHEYEPTHIHAFNPLYVANFLFALMRTDIPLIYRCGDTPILHNFFYKQIWAFIKSRTAAFVADSQFIAHELAKTGIKSEKIAIIYAPAPRRTASNKTETLVPPLRDREIRFVYVGQLTVSKGVGLLIDAFKLVAKDHKDALLLIAGPISAGKHDAWAQSMRNRVASDSTLAHRVIFLGYVHDIPALLANCHVHVAPSLRLEPYGLVVLEAKEAGIPSIILKSGGMVELVENRIDGIVADRKDAVALSEALSTYITSPAQIRNHGKAARASLDRLGVREFGTRWMGVYGQSELSAGSSQLKLKRS
jgi:glycosyltransferase involved in cell wall biosynthesis